MNYELAKQLKDAGFSQPIKPEERLPQEGIYTQMGSDGEPVYSPTLSELIESCGTGFVQVKGTLELLKCSYCDGKHWTAIAREDQKLISENGVTPEEAVANLYIALHKK